MRGFVSKFFRKEAHEELAKDIRAERDLDGRRAPERELVQRKSGEIINSPTSVRHLYLALKRAYKRKRAGISEIWNYKVARAQALANGVLIKVEKIRGHGKKKPSRSQPDDRIMTIQKPLDLILQHCPPSETPTGGYELHPVYRSAQIAAKRGRGDLVQKMARQFLPA